MHKKRAEKWNKRIKNQLNKEKQTNKESTGILSTDQKISELFPYGKHEREFKFSEI